MQEFGEMPGFVFPNWVNPVGNAHWGYFAVSDGCIRAMVTQLDRIVFYVEFRSTLYYNVMEPQLSQKF